MRRRRPTPGASSAAAEQGDAAARRGPCGAARRGGRGRRACGVVRRRGGRADAVRPAPDRRLVARAARRRSSWRGRRARRERVLDGLGRGRRSTLRRAAEGVRGTGRRPRRSARDAHGPAAPARQRDGEQGSEYGGQTASAAPHLELPGRMRLAVASLRSGEHRARAPHPAADRPRLDAPAGRRHGHEPLRPGRALARVGPPGHGHRRAPTRAPSAVEQLRRRGLTLHRMGTRHDGLPARRAGRSRRGLGRDADVVLEVVNGIAFFTPLWWCCARRASRSSTTSIRTTTSPRWAARARSPRCSPRRCRCSCSTAARRS